MKLTFEEKRILLMGAVEILGLIVAVTCGFLILEIVGAL